ncbi:MAG: carbohydrate kinase family protein [Bryobacterales bacterium]|nr:carbohydrate kinase family protein [Bryobacterales bacterium]
MLLVAGNLVYDWIAGPVSELAWEQTTWPESFATGIGGNGATTAYAAARLGAPVRLVTARGDDAHGAICDERLASAGVERVYLPGLTGGTAVTMGVFRPGGARALIHRPGVLVEAFQNVSSLRLFGAGVSWLHIGNPFAVPGLRRHAASYLREARDAGWTTSLDLGWDRLGEWMRVVGPCLPYCDWLFANAAEAQALGPFESPATVVIKRGAGGCTVNGVSVPGVPVNAVDSTGAGDSFCGAFIAAAMRGLEPLAAARVANAYGAQSVSAAGATTALQGWDSVGAARLR